MLKPIARLGACLIVAASAAASAQTVEAKLGDSPKTSRSETEIFFDEATWRAIAEGKTLYYASDLGPVGKEYYYEGSNRVVFMFHDGTCFDGAWSENDGVFCFEYDQQYCFYHVQRGGEIYARSVNDGDEQVVTDFLDEPLSCDAGMVSALPLARGDEG